MDKAIKDTGNGVCGDEPRPSITYAHPDDVFRGSQQGEQSLQARIDNAVNVLEYGISCINAKPTPSVDAIKKWAKCMADTLKKLKGE